MIHIFVTDLTVSYPFGLVHIENLSVHIFFSCCVEKNAFAKVGKALILNFPSILHFVD